MIQVINIIGRGRGGDVVRGEGGDTERSRLTGGWRLRCGDRV